jgi:Uma2 family endonuclease
MIETKLYTRNEYLTLEEAENRRYDFFNGEIIEIDMGASETHQIICANLAAQLLTALHSTHCRVLTSGMRVHTPNGLDTYPDIIVVCGSSHYVEPKTDTGRDTLTNPMMLIEVLSKSTRDYDRGDKFFSYRTIPSLQDFLTIDQARVFVEHFHKIKTGEWLLREFSDLNDSLTLSSLGVSITLKEIYNKTDLAP